MAGSQGRTLRKVWDCGCIMRPEKPRSAVMFEALGCGKPFVGTKVGGVPEIITSDGYVYCTIQQIQKKLEEKILIALDKEWALWPLEKGLRSFIEMKQFVSEEQIHATKIPEDLWPGEGWGKLGHVIEVVMGCFVSGDVK